MSPLLKQVKIRALRIVPAFLFFFITFFLLNITWGLMLREEGISRFDFSTVLIAAAIVAKVFIIIDNLPFTNAFSNKPLIYQTIWKTTLYGTLTMIIRLLDYLIPFVWSSKSLSIGLQYFIVEVDWPRFWAIQFWFVVLFFIFVAVRELVMTIGPAKMRRIFFGGWF